jgi:hypothetical protein
MLFASVICKAQTSNTDGNPKWDYQIYLKQPAKEIEELYYSDRHEQINGKLSQDGKTIIVKDYEKKNPVHVKVLYQDGTIDEFIRSSCYIDPVI